MRDLTAEIEQTILGKNLLQPGQFVLVAVSGGLDSIVLLHVLCHLSDKHGWLPVVAHFNHQLRGVASDADELFVKKTAERLGLKCVVGQGHVKKLASKNKISVEMAARQLRHQFLARTCSSLDIQNIALGHHADDQAELFFVRLLRGTGGGGLSGMDWQAPSPANPELKLIRPLLGVAKADLHDFAKERNLSFREDESNAHLDILRNRIRRELLPLLQAKYQGGIIKTTLRTMDVICEETEFVQQAAVQWMQRKSRRPSFNRLHIAVQRQVVNLGLLQLGIKPDFDLIECLRGFENRPVMVAPELTVWRDAQGNICSKRLSEAAFQEGEALVDFVAGQGRLYFGGLKIAWECRVGLNRFEDVQDQQRCHEYFDQDKVGGKVILRHWRPGDRFQPIGMSKAVKIQDLFTNQKVLREQRHKMVIATTSQGEVFWVEGLRISEGFKVHNETKALLSWQWERDDFGVRL